MHNKKTVLITGASSGIGKACAEKFAEGGFRIIITARRQEKLETLAKNLWEKYNADVFCLCFDVRDLEQTQKAISGLPSEWSVIDILINNAGLAAG